MGAAVATVLSRFSLLGFLMVRTKSKFGIILRKIDVIKPIIAAIPMGVFLFLFNYHIDINLFWGLLEILIGIIIYFSFLFLIKGIGIEEINLIKSFKTKKIKND